MAREAGASGLRVVKQFASWLPNGCQMASRTVVRCLEMGRCLAKRGGMVVIVTAEARGGGDNRVCMLEGRRSPGRRGCVAILAGVAGSEVRGRLPGGGKMGGCVVMAGKAVCRIGGFRVHEDGWLE